MTRRPEIGQEVQIWQRGWLAPSPTVRRDPLSIGVAFLVNIGWTGAISGIGATIVGSVILGAAALGASLLANALFSPAQMERSPSERQSTIRQSLGPRVRFYGRVKVGGTLWFFETKSGFLYSAVTINEGQIDSVLEYWLNDQQVTLSGNLVTTAPYDINGGVARIYVKNGQPDQTVHSVLDAAFPEITEAHRFRGVANFLSLFDEVSSEDIPKVYPQLNPQVRLVINASMVTSVRTGEYIWSDLAGDAIYDYLVAVDGAGIPYGAGYLESQIDKPSFEAFTDLCDVDFPLKSGGTIKQYRIWGGYALNEEMRNTLPRMLRTCDADLYMTTEGKIAIRGGQWEAPQLTLDDRLGHIISGQFRHGQGSLAAFNELTITYTEPTLDYQENEAERWLDSGNIAMRGKVLTSQLDLLMVPHHAQARHLGKIHTARSNPEWVGTIITNYYGMNAIGENMVHIVFPILGIDDDFVVQSVQILDDLTGVEIQISSLSASAYEWDAELEEGLAPGQPPDTTTPVELDPPEDINVSAAERDIGGGGTGVFLLTTWTEPARTALEQEVEYRSLPDGTWIPMSVSDGVPLAESSLVSSGTDYEVRVRTRAPAGQRGDWNASIPITATPDTSAPDPVDNLAAVSGVGVVDMDFDFSPSLNAIGARIYRNTINVSGSATLISTLYGSPGVAVEFADVALAAGTYYYWIAAFNGSDFTESTLEATGEQVVT